MTEKEFIERLNSIGLNKEKIQLTVDHIKTMMISEPELTFENILPIVINANEKSKNRPKGSMIFDG